MSKVVKSKKGRKPGKYYIDNSELVKEIRDFYKTEVFSRQLGLYVLKIVDGIAHSPNFMNYSYLEEMRGDATWRITKAITDKGCKIVPEELVGEHKKDEEGNLMYNTVKIEVGDDEFITELALDKDGNKTPTIVAQNNIFGYFSMIAWRAFQNRIKIEKKFHNTSEEYKEKVFDEFEQEYNIPHDSSHIGSDDHDYDK
jgi:hypothetical protein